MAKKNTPPPTNGPYHWGNPPQPKPKGIIAKIIAKIENVGNKK